MLKNHTLVVRIDLDEVFVMVLKWRLTIKLLVIHIMGKWAKTVEMLVEKTALKNY